MRFRAILGVGLILLACAAVPVLGAATHYIATDLGTLGGPYADGYGINANEQVVGYSRNVNYEGHAFLYDHGSMIDLGTFGGVRSYAQAINQSGQIVGGAYPPTGSYHAFRYSNGTMADLGTFPGGDFSEALAINRSGQIVGDAEAADLNRYAFLYTGGSMINLGALGGSGSCAFGVNAAGQVVGRVYTSQGEQHAFLYTGGTMTDLGTSATASVANAINDSGQVVGAAGPSAGPQHAFLYSSATMADLGTLGGLASEARAVNATGVVVGKSTFDTSGVYHAFVDDGTAMLDLNSLVRPDLGRVLSSAEGINDNGWIVANAMEIFGADRPFLLRPALPGDANLDGAVDMLDLGPVLTNFDKSGMAWGRGDFDGDGTITIADLNKVLTNFDKTLAAAAPGATSVPEPVSSVLLGMAGLSGLWIGRRRRDGAL